MAKKSKQPKRPANRDLGSEMADLAKYQEQGLGMMRQASLETNQGFIDQALAATDTIAGKLNNGYTAAGRAALDGAMGQIPQMDRAAGRLSALGDVAAGDVTGTNIERMLTRQAEEELGLGRTLSAEEERAATQSARGAFASRGMAVGKPSAIAEILNRQSAGDARLAGRRGFAGEVNQMVSGNRIARLGQAGSLTGQEAQVRGNTAQLGMAGAQGYIALDPYQRALQSNIPIASQGASAGMTTSGYGQTLGYVSDLQNTNFSADWTDYMSRMNRYYAGRYGGLGGGGGGPSAGNVMAGVGMGALSGAATGSVAGPYGAAAGAVVGGVLGGVGASQGSSGGGGLMG